MKVMSALLILLLALGMLTPPRAAADPVSAAILVLQGGLSLGGLTLAALTKSVEIKARGDESTSQPVDAPARPPFPEFQPVER